ncbi:MAG: OmpA family protein [Bacteroidetes bacterium]|nr:OmpA family protein [Bacteroidota bacterium]
MINKQTTKLRAFITLIFIIFLSFHANASEIDTNYRGYSIILSANAGLASHHSNFYTLPSVINCCGVDDVIFNKAYGLNFSVLGGIAKYYDIFNGAYLSLNLGFNNINANYNKSSKIGNYIQNDDVSDIISEEILNASLYSVSLVPMFDFFLADRSKLPLFMRLGADLGFVLGNNYEMYENIKSPTEALFENGTKRRNESDGSITNINSLSFGVLAGLGYELFSFDNIKISPYFQYYYGLTDVVKDLDWKYNKFNVGVNVEYALKKDVPVVDPPIVPQLPKLTPPASKEIVFNTLVYLNDSRNQTREITNNSIIEQRVDINKITYTNSVMPILLFETNTDKIVNGYDKNLIGWLRNQNKLNVEIGLSYSENETLINSRKTALKKFLYVNNIDTNNIQFTSKASSKQRYNEIDAEKSYARFKTPILEYVDNEQSVIDSVYNSYLEVKTEISGIENPYNYLLSYSIGGNSNSSSNENLRILLNRSTLDWSNEAKETDINIIAKVNSVGQTVEGNSLSYKVIPNINYDKYVNSNKNNNYKEEYVIGYFDFDSDEFIYTSDYVVSIIKNCLNSGRKVEIIGYTDNLGTNEYNNQLAKQRAAAAKSLFNNNVNISIGVVIRKSAINSAYDRLHSRMVVARIK